MIKLTSKLIYDNNRTLTSEYIASLENKTMDFEDVPKGELKVFLAFLWEQYNDICEKYGQLEEKIRES